MYTKDNPRFQEILSLLEYYAAAVRNRQIDRRRFIAAYGQGFDLNNRFPYPYDDADEVRLYNKVDAYFLGLSPEDKARANATLLWCCKDYLSVPFAKHAVALIERNVEAYPLADGDKVKFLEYVFASNKQFLFNPRTLYKLADYDSSQNREMTNRLYNKALAKFANFPRKNDKYVALVYNMFRNVAHRLQTISPEEAANYAAIYFKMSEKTSAELNAAVLGNLMLKTPAVVGKKLPNGQKMLDKEAMKQVVAAYGRHARNQRELNQMLYQQMYWLTDVVIGKYGYNHDEAAELAGVLRTEAVLNGRASKKNDMLENLAVQMETKFDPQAVQNDKIDAIPLPKSCSRSAILSYADKLFDAAARQPDAEVSAAGLKTLILGHASANGFDIVQPTIFSEGYKKKAVDKSLVFDIAAAYADSVQITQYEYSEYNSSLAADMQKMFTEFVTQYGYKKSEMLKLTERLAQGAGKAPCFQKMSKEIVRSYTAPSTGRGGKER